MMSYLHSKFNDNWISSFRGVAMTRFWDGQTDGQTDGVTALLDLLSLSETQVKNQIRIPCEYAHVSSKSTLHVSIKLHEILLSGFRGV